MKKGKNVQLVKGLILGGILLTIFLIVFMNLTGKVIESPCTDSDGGPNYYLKGYTSTVNKNLIDSCIDNYQGKVNMTVREWVCQSNQDAIDSAFECPNGCKDGACITGNNTNSCSETDNGEEYHSVKGNCLDLNGYLTDSCVNPTLLSESSCSSSYNCEFSKFDCTSLGPSYYCNNGACVRNYSYIPTISDNTEEPEVNESEETPAKITEEPKQPACTPEYLCAYNPQNCPENGMQTEICTDLKCKTQGTERIVSCNPGTCSGCKSDAQCLPYGFRVDANNKSLYCDLDSDLKEQKTRDSEGNWDKCKNNFECKSNICTNDECVDVNALAAKGGVFKSTLVSILCKLLHPFSDDNYNSCLYSLFK